MFVLNVGIFDNRFYVLHVFATGCLPGVLALGSFLVDPREIGIAASIFIVPDAVVIDSGEVIDLPVRRMRWSSRSSASYSLVAASATSTPKPHSSGMSKFKLLSKFRLQSNQ